MTPPAPARTHIWDGTRTLPDWLTGHHWTAGQLVIHTPDGDTRPQPGWWLIGWTDGSVTAATPTVAARVYGPDGIAGRLAAAETEAARLRADIAACQAQQWPQRLAAAEKTLARIQAVADDHPAGIDTALIHEALDQTGPLTPAEEARLAQAGVDTPGCDCGHDGMGVSWHGDDCPWRRSLVDCPGRPTPG